MDQGDFVAIDFINVSIVSAGRGESALGLGAYIARQKWRNPITGRCHDFSGDAGDLIGDLVVLLPDGADPTLADPRNLWAAAERAEVTLDRKTRLPRFKKGAALAKHVILALPRGLEANEQRELAVSWAKTKFPGVGVMLAIHQSDDTSTENVHAHLLVTTRTVGPHGLGGKARHLDPRFAGRAGTTYSYLEPENLPGQWRAFQNDFFKRKGIPLIVDPSLAVTGKHWGKARFVRNNDKEADDRAAKVAARARLKDPKEVAKELTRNRSTFSRKSVEALLRRHDIQGKEATSIAEAMFGDPSTIALHDPETGRLNGLYTTRAVRDQEQRILMAADNVAKSRPSKQRLARLATSATTFANAMGLAAEQRAALMHAIGGGGISLIRGVAGAGKSYTVKAIRQALEENGFDVLGLAPTNTVVFDMAKDEFSRATTLHSEKYRMEKPRANTSRWNRRTCIIVDEAGMVDSGMFEWLLEAAAEAGARVILVGDDAQLSSVERGGMFGALRSKLGAAELKEIRRQDDDWAKTASLDLAEGRISTALRAYDGHGKIHWSSDLEGAAHELVARWGVDAKTAPETPRFVYVATNAVANDLNNRLQAEKFGNREDFGVFDCSRGRIQLYRDDRVQFHATDKKLCILNGQIGTVTAFSDEEITVDIDGGGAVSFDPKKFDGWGLGYAGTVYRGQGKTLPQAYALYDHVRSWSARSTYVALTRHRKAFDLFVPRSLARDLDVLGRQMTRNDDAGASLTYLTAEEAAVRFPSVPIRVRAEDGHNHDVNAADPSSDEAINRHLAVIPVRRFRSDYIRLDEAAKEADRHHPVPQRASDARAIARRRGFIPRSGTADPRCLEDLKRQDPLHTDDLLAPGRGEVDIRPLLQDPVGMSVDLLRQAKGRLRELEALTLKAIDRSLQAAWTRAGTDERRRYPVVLARAFLQSWTYRWQKRLGTDVISPLPPGEYRRNYLTLLDKARKTMRLHEVEAKPGLPEAASKRKSLPSPAPERADLREVRAAALPAFRQDQLERERLRALSDRLEKEIHRLTAALKKPLSEHEREKAARTLAMATLKKQSVERDLDGIGKASTVKPRPPTALPPAELASEEAEERSVAISGMRAGETPRNRQSKDQPSSAADKPADFDVAR